MSSIANAFALFRRALAPFALGLLLIAPAARSQTTYTWAGGASAAWTTAASWSPARTSPATSDILLFNSGTSVTVTGVPTETIGQLSVVPSGPTSTTVNLQAVSAGRVVTIAGGTGVDLAVAAGCALNMTGASSLKLLLGASATGSISGGMTLSGGTQTLDATTANTLAFESGGSLQQNCAGNVFTAAGTANAVLFKSGSTFVRLQGSSPFGLAQPASKVTFAAGSLYSHQQATAPDLAGRTYGNFEYKVASTQSATGSATLTLGSLTVSQGTLNIGMTGTFNLQGDILVGGGTLNFNAASAATILLNGSAAQNLTVTGGNLTLGTTETLQLNNPAGLVLGSGFLLNSGTLNLATGNLTTGANILDVASPGTLVAGATGWVVGTLRQITPSSGTLTYPLGSATGYAPVTFTFGAASGGIGLAVTLTSGDHPDLANSTIDPTRSVNRYWTVSAPGNPVLANAATVAFTYQVPDMDAGANPALFRVARSNGGWTTFASSSGTSSTATVSGLTTLSGDYAAGEGSVVYRWAGGASGGWSVSSSWNPQRSTPASTDILLFDVGGPVSVGSLPNEQVGQLQVTGGTDLTLSGLGSNRTITLGGRPGTDLAVDAGSSLTLSGSGGTVSVALLTGATGSIAGGFTLTGTAAHTLNPADSGAVTFQGGAVMQQFSPGHAFGSTGAANVVTFAAGSSLEYSGNGQYPFGLTAPASRIVLAPGSLFRQLVDNGVDFSGRTYGNFEYHGATSGNSSGASGSGAVSLGTFVVSRGTFNLGMSGACSITGDVVVSGGATLALNGTIGNPEVVSLAGTTPQNLLVSGTLTGNGLATLRVNNPAGVNLAGGVTLAGIDLLFTQGLLKTNAATLTVPAGSTISGAGAATGWVHGNLRRGLTPSGGEATARFDIGDATRYAPVDVALHGLAASFDLTARTTTPDHPSMGTAPLDGTRSVNRWWTLTPATTPTFSTLDATLAFDAADLDAGAATNHFRVARYSAATWSALTPGTRTATSTQAVGITGFGDFAVADPPPVTIVASAGVGGTIAPAGSLVVPYGTDQAFTFTPAPGYHVASVTVDGVGVGAPASYTFTSVAANHVISVTFIKDCGFGPIAYVGQWGGAGTGNGQFNTPTSLAVDNAGHVFVADYQNDRCQRFNTAGAFEMAWGTSGGGNGQFGRPYGIAADALGHVFVSDTWNNRIQKFDTAGNYLAQWGGPGSGPGQFDNPVGLGVDGANRVLVAEQFNNRVQVFDNSGAFVRTFGTFGGGAGEMIYPYHSATAPNGNVYVAEIGNSRVQVFDAAGAPLFAFGSAGSGDGQFGTDGPRSVALDSQGRVYVADSGNDRIQVFSAGGTFLAKWGTTGSGNGQFNHPESIAIDAQGRIFVADTGNNRVQVFGMMETIVATAGAHGIISPSGNVAVPCHATASFTFTPDPGYVVGVVRVDGQNVGGPPSYAFTDVIAGHTIDVTFVPDCVASLPVFLAKWGVTGTATGQFNRPTSLAVDNAGHVFVADYLNDRCQRFSTSGVFETSWGIAGSGDGEFFRPYGIAADALGHVFVSDTGNDRIQKFDAAGAYLAQWGGFGGDPGQFYNPVGLSVDDANRVTVSEQYNERVQVFDNDGAFVRTFGSYGGGPGQMTDPYHAVTAPNGNVYVAEIGNSRVQVFDPAGAPLFAFGSAGSGNGQFGIDGPRGLALDSQGHVYVADSGNDRIQVFSAGGAFITKWGTSGTGNGQFNHPESIAIDGDGYIYVADTHNNRIQKFGCGPAVSTASEVPPPAALTLRATPNPGQYPRLLAGVPTAGRVEIVAFDVTGRRVRTLLDAILPAGEHVIPWDGRGDDGEALASGVYFVRVMAGGLRGSTSVLLVH